MAKTNQYKCQNCGRVVDITEALNPPTKEQQATPKPCPGCGQTNWQKL